MVTFEHVRVPMRDGVRLGTFVHRPDSGRSPVLLIRSPYGAELGNDAVVRPFVHPGGAEALAELGWAVVHQDTRGRYTSEGELEPFRHDVDDGEDTIEWCSAQRWSAGRVVMACPSGLGATQHLAALCRHPALAAISPVVGVSHPRTGWVVEGGAIRLMFVTEWAAQQTFVFDRSFEMAAEPLATSSLRELAPFADAWVRDEPEYWAPIEKANVAGPAEVPAFHTSGWHDIFAEGSLEAYRRMREAASSERVRQSQRLVVGPWSHTTLWQRTVGEIDYGPEADGSDGRFQAEILAWLAAAARGDDVPGGAHIFVMGTNRWFEMPTWPPPSTPLALYLSPGGVLTRAPGAEASDGFRYDPASPVPTHGGRALYIPDGPLDQREIEARDDVLTYTTPPLSESVTVMGKVTADILFATSGRSADVTVKLVDVHPDGRAYTVVDSVTRSGFSPGRRRRVHVDVGHTAITFPAGHSVRVEVSSSNFPRLDRNPSTGEPGWKAETLEPADQTVSLGGRRPSVVTLPVVSLAAS